MSVYFDASTLLPALVRDAFSPAVDAFVARLPEPPLVSEFAAAEVAAALGRMARSGVLTEDDVRARLGDFDLWRSAAATTLDLDGADVRLAGLLVRRLELQLTTAEALHLAICRRVQAQLFTFERRLAAAAGVLGQPVVGLGGA